jgi:PAS domain S-box-containing protein
LHELQVHQIELEMQNEELRKAYETAEAALKKYTLIFDQAPMGFVTLESDGTITELNFTSAEMLGDRRFSLIGSNFKLYISDESKSAFNSFFANVYTSHKKETCKVMLGYENKSLFQVYIEGIVIENDSKCMLSLVDVTSFTE